MSASQADLAARYGVHPIYPKAMPVLLHEGDETRWLTAAWDDAVSLISPYPSQLMAVATGGEPFR